MTWAGDVTRAGANTAAAGAGSGGAHVTVTDSAAPDLARRK